MRAADPTYIGKFTLENVKLLRDGKEDQFWDAVLAAPGLKNKNKSELVKEFILLKLFNGYWRLANSEATTEISPDNIRVWKTKPKFLCSKGVGDLYELAKKGRITPASIQQILQLNKDISEKTKQSYCVLLYKVYGLSKEKAFASLTITRRVMLFHDGSAGDEFMSLFPDRKKLTMIGVGDQVYIKEKIGQFYINIIISDLPKAMIKRRRIGEGAIKNIDVLLITQISEELLLNLLQLTPKRVLFIKNFYTQDFIAQNKKSLESLGIVVDASTKDEMKQRLITQLSDNMAELSKEQLELMIRSMSKKEDALQTKTYRYDRNEGVDQYEYHKAFIEVVKILKQPIKEALDQLRCAYSANYLHEITKAFDTLDQSDKAVTSCKKVLNNLACFFDENNLNEIERKKGFVAFNENSVEFKKAFSEYLMYNEIILRGGRDYDSHRENFRSLHLEKPVYIELLNQFMSQYNQAQKYIDSLDGVAKKIEVMISADTATKPSVALTMRKIGAIVCSGPHKTILKADSEKNAGPSRRVHFKATYM